MKNFSVLMLICLSGLIFANIRSANAQKGDDRYVLLSDYGYTPDDLLVGTITIHRLGTVAGASNGSDADFALRGEHAGKFKIKKGNQLYIRGKYAKSDKKWFDVGVVTTDGQLSADFRAVKNELVRKSVVLGKSVAVRVDLGGCRI